MTTLSTSVTARDSGPGSCTVVELAGEADVTGSEALHDLLEAETRKRPDLLIIKMSGLRFADSAALQAIVRAGLALVKAGGRLALVNPHDTVARVLSMTEIDRLVPVYASVEDAVAG